MWLSIITALFSFISLIAGVFKGFNDKYKKKIAWILAIVGLLALLVNIYSAVKSNKKSLEKQKQIDSLQFIVKESNDTILILNQKVDQLSINLDSALRNSKNLQFSFDRMNRPVFYIHIDLDDEEKVRINGILKEGMEIKVKASNCQGTVAFVHNSKRELINENNDRTWETVVKKDGVLNESYLYNEGNSPCGMRIEFYIFQSNFTVNDSIWIDQEIAEEDNKEPPSETCLLEEFDFLGKWQLIMNYNTCYPQKGNKNLTDLILYFDIYSFNKVDNNFELKGNKIGENKHGEEVLYSREMLIQIDDGYLENCKIILPIEGGKDGQIILDEIERIGEFISLKGDFKNSRNGCSGTVLLEKI